MRISWSLRTSITILFYSLLVAFLLFYLHNIDAQKLSHVRLSPLYALLASVAALLFRYWGVLTWFVLLKGLGAQGLEKNIRGLSSVYAKAWMGRYIPGTAPWILGKIYFASRYGISKKTLAVSSLLEGALQVVVTLALACVMLLLDARFDMVAGRAKWSMVGVLAACLILMLPPVFNKATASAYRILRKQELERKHYANRHTMAAGAALNVAGSLLGGLSFYLTAKATYSLLPLQDMVFVIATNNLAGAISMLAVFAPSGIGVREGVQVALLSLIMPTEIALAVSVVSRVWSLLIDIVFFALTRSCSGH